MTQISTVTAFAIIAATIVLMFIFNTYKFDLFNSLDGKQYVIFPWQTPGQLSKSTSQWLTLHLAVSMVHVLVTAVWVMINYNNRIFTNGHLIDPFWLDISHAITHWMFVVIIVFNRKNFGELSTNAAIMASMIPLLIANYFYLVSTSRNRKLYYFLTITSPIWLETFAWTANLLRSLFV